MRPWPRQTTSSPNWPDRGNSPRSVDRKEVPMALQVMRFDDMDWRRPDAAVPEAIAQLVSSDYTPPAGLLLIGYDAEAQEKVIATAGFRRVTPVVCEARNVVVFWGYQ